MILITGATGYIGRHLVARLAAESERPRCLVRDTKRAASILPADKVELVQGDTIHPATLTAAMSGVDTVVHAAFITADHKESAGNHYGETNVHGTENVIKASRQSMSSITTMMLNSVKKSPKMATTPEANRSFRTSTSVVTRVTSRPTGLRS